MVGVAYFLYKLIIMHLPGDDHYMFEASLSQLTMYAVLSLVFLSATIINEIICARNTGKGLNDYFYTPNSTKLDGRYVLNETLDASSQNLLRYHPMPERLSLE